MSFKESIERAINEVYSGKSVSSIIETLKGIDKGRMKHFISLPRNPETRKRKSSKAKNNVFFPRYDKPSPVDERSLPIIETCCSHFGCGNTLSMTEKLFGNKCVDHQFNKKTLFHNGKL